MRFSQRLVAVVLLLPFIMTTIMSEALSADMPGMPQLGASVLLSPGFTPAQLTGLAIDLLDPFKLDFIINRGDLLLSPEQKRLEYKRLIKYFLASLAVPDIDQWVNLSPFEKDRIIPDSFGKTEMGGDLLAQDYLLKQISASLTNPDSDLGKRFWGEVYAKAYEQFGSTDIPTNTFNKVWIMPDKAVVYEKNNAVYVLEHHLKVMLDTDYLAQAQKRVPFAGQAIPAQGVPAAQVFDREPAQELIRDVLRSVIVPALEKEVNEGKNFARLRQVYSGMILSAWYKYTLKNSILYKVYGDRSKVGGIDQDPMNNQQIYDQYLSALRKGVYHFIREEAVRGRPETGVESRELIPRKYFSGGAKGDVAEMFADASMVTRVTNEPVDFAIQNDVVTAVLAKDHAMTYRQAVAKREELNFNKNYYQWLGVKKNASLSEIKRAFHKSVMLWHPDKHPETLEDAAVKEILGEVTKKFIAAWEVLKDAQKRGRYDLEAVSSSFVDSQADAADATVHDDDVTSDSVWQHWSGVDAAQSSTQLSDASMKGVLARLLVAVVGAGLFFGGVGYMVLPSLHSSLKQTLEERRLEVEKRVLLRKQQRKVMLQLFKHNKEFYVLDSEFMRAVRLRDRLKKVYSKVLDIQDDLAAAKTLRTVEAWAPFFTDDWVSVLGAAAAQSNESSALSSMEELKDTIVEFERDEIHLPELMETGHGFGKALIVPNLLKEIGVPGSLSFLVMGLSASDNVAQALDNFKEISNALYLMQNTLTAKIEQEFMPKLSQMIAEELSVNPKKYIYGNTPEVQQGAQVVVYALGRQGVVASSFDFAYGDLLLEQVAVEFPYGGSQLVFLNEISPANPPAVFSGEGDAEKIRGVIRQFLNKLKKYGKGVEATIGFAESGVSYVEDVAVIREDKVLQWFSEDKKIGHWYYQELDNHLRISKAPFKSDKVEALQYPSDRAMTASQQKQSMFSVVNGGIDMNAGNLDLEVKRDGQGMLLPISQQDLDNIHFKGLIPIIVDIQPAISVWRQLQ